MERDSSSAISLADYWRMILRRKWLALAIFSACVVGAGVLCAVLPESYRSSTLILVEGQKIPEKYVQSVISPTIEQRLSSLQQQVMSRTVLTKMIEEFALYPELVRADGIDAVVSRVRKAIRVETMGARSERREIDAFAISFAHQNPMVAMNVTSRLATQFIEENLKAREQLVEGASEFLEQELALAKERLEGQEKTISQYKTKYMGELPEQVQANISALDRLQAQHSAAVEAIQKSTDRLTLIEKMIKEYESPVMAGVAAVQGPGGVVVVDPLVARLKELEKNLTALSAEYKNTYPDIAYLKQEIQAVKAQLKEKKETAEEKNGSKEPSLSAKDVKPTDLYLRELMRQRDEARLEIASLKDRLARTRVEMNEYEKRVEKAPTREQELEILVRDYNNLKENYRTLLDKKLNARLAENLEKRQKGEQFRIMDPANLPNKPDTPDRLKIMLLGVLLGCGLSTGSAIGLELLRPVFRRSEDVESLLHLKVIASIPSFKILLGEAQKNLSAKPLASLGGGRNRLLTSRVPTGEPSGKNAVVGGAEAARTPALAMKPRSERANVLRELELIAKWNPWSVVAEQFRVAATRLALLQYASKGKVTVVTSAVKGEGKSVVAANLAYALARDMGKRTLLVDGDLKCPTAHHYWGSPQSPGLRDVLQGSQSIESCLLQEGELPLWILPLGGDRGRAVDDLSRIGRISEIIGELKKLYDFILVDAPPVLPLADMHMIAGMADMVAIVIRAGLTPRTVVESALRTLGASANNLCIILNELETGGLPYYMQEGYGYSVGRKEIGLK
ncbi:MAG: AAA family ATPase [Nitrospiraceae bacterium]